MTGTRRSATRSRIHDGVVHLWDRGARVAQTRALGARGHLVAETQILEFPFARRDLATHSPRTLGPQARFLMYSLGSSVNS